MFNPHRIGGHRFPPTFHRPFLRYLTDPTDPAGGNPTDLPADPPADPADPPGSEHLGDPGKRALDAMKADKKAALDRAKAAEDQLAALQAQINGQQEQHQQQLEQQRIRDEGIAKGQLVAKKTWIRALAVGKLADPEDAIAFINLDDIEIDDNGSIDTAAAEAAIAELLTKKPHLAAQGGQRFQGGGDGGARNGAPGPHQLTAEDVEKMTPEQVDAARRGGQLDRLLGAKP